LSNLAILSPDPVCACGAATTQILDIVGRADQMVKVGSRAFYPQEVGDWLLSFSELVRPPRFTVHVEQQEDAQYVLLDAEVQAGLDAEEVERLRQRVADKIMLSQFWLVKVGVARLVVSLVPAGSLERPFAYTHRHLVLATRPGADPGQV